MAVVIDGTTGISTPAEAVAGNLSYTGTLTGGAGVINLGSGQVYKDASGNVGIGTSSPASYGKLAVVGDITLASASAALRNVGTYTMINDLGSNAVNVGNAGAGAYLKFQTAVGDAARIDSSGRLLVGTTSTSVTNGGVTISPIQGGAGSSGVIIGHASGVISGDYFSAFTYNGSVIGSITQSGTTAVAYNTTSDYRLKENVQPIPSALARVAALKPCTYTWKSAPDEIGEGFIAHELAEVCPQAVTGEKDAVNEDGSVKPQSIDTSFLVATLAAAIQEQQALIAAQAISITALNERLTALEAA